MRNYPQTILSQYSSSPHLLALLDDIDQWISPDANLEGFYQLIWDIRPVGGAIGAGLDIWGRIVGVSRVLTVVSGQFFGFGEAEDRGVFGEYPFQLGQPTTTKYTLDDETYRLLIFAKAAFNITNGSVESINALKMNLFPARGNAYVTDGNNGPTGVWFGFGEAEDRADFSGGGPFGDFMPNHPSNMSLIYVFDFVLTPEEIAIVTVSGVLPRPTGVKAHWRYLT